MVEVRNFARVVVVCRAQLVVVGVHVCDGEKQVPRGHFIRRKGSWCLTPAILVPSAVRHFVAVSARVRLWVHVYTSDVFSKFEAGQQSRTEHRIGTSATKERRGKGTNEYINRSSSLLRPSHIESRRSVEQKQNHSELCRRTT